jgi:hypothetical protein
MNAALVIAAGILALGSGDTAKPRIAIVPVIAGGATTDPARVREQVSDVVRRYPSLSFVETDDPFAEIDADARPECIQSADCFAPLLARIGVALGLVVVVNFDTDPIFVGLRLFDAQKHRWIAEDVGSLRPAERDLSAALTMRTERALASTGAKRYERLTVRTSPNDAGLAIDPPLAITAGGSRAFLLPSGRYVVRAARDGFQPKSTAVDVALGKDAELTIALDPEPAPPIIESPWLWIGIGATAAAAVTATIIVLASGTRYLCIGKQPCP